jgi:hypothetical protein
MSISLFGNYSKIKVNPHLGCLTAELSHTDLKSDLSLLNQMYAIQYRDETLVHEMKFLGVMYVVDVGCDFGSLIWYAGKAGMTSIGFDNSEHSLKLCSDANLHAENVSFQTIAKFGIPEKFLIGFEQNTTAVSLLNVLHGNWLDEEMRNALITHCISISRFLVITATKHQLRLLKQTHNLRVVTFIGNNTRPITKISSRLSQYGLPFMFKNHILARLESVISRRVLKIVFIFPQKILNYSSLCVILEKNVPEKHLAPKS